MNSEKWMKALYERLWRNNESPTSQSENIVRLSGLDSNGPVIVRSEYISIWNWIEETRTKPRGNRSGLVLLGHPGNGKSAFLKFALCISLSKKIPVVYCNMPDVCFAFDQNGCNKKWFRETLSDDLPANPLVLVDSSSSLLSPPALFASKYFRGFVVSSDGNGWSSWTRERRAVVWVMPLWTRSEITSLQYFIESNSPKCEWLQGDYYTPEELFDIVGPSARECFGRVRPRSSKGLLDDFGNDYAPETLDLDPDRFVKALESGDAPSTRQNSTFHKFFFGSNSRSSNPVISPDLSYTIPTPFLRGLVYEKYRVLALSNQLALARKLSPFPQVTSALYEPMVIHALRFATMPLNFHICHPAGLTLQIGPGLHAAPYMVLPTDHPETHFTPECNRIHILPAGFAPLNAFIVCEDGKCVISLRIATSQDLDLKPEAITKVVKLFPETERQSIQWIFLFVGPNQCGEAITQKPVKLVNVDEVEIEVCMGWITVSSLPLKFQ